MEVYSFLSFSFFFFETFTNLSRREHSLTLSDGVGGRIIGGGVERVLVCRVTVVGGNYGL